MSSKIQQDRPDGGKVVFQKRLSWTAARGVKVDEVRTRGVSNR